MKSLSIIATREKVSWICGERKEIKVRSYNEVKEENDIVTSPRNSSIKMNFFIKVSHGKTTKRRLTEKDVKNAI